MKIHVALALAVVSCLQVVAAENIFENVQPITPQLPFDLSRAEGPAKNIFDFVDESMADPHIVGGKEAVPHSHPHQVALKILFHGDTLFCGGSLISNQWVLTAAHCASGFTNITAVVGAHSIKENEPSARSFIVEEIIVHPGWSRKTLQNDIALLRLNNTVSLDGKYVNTIRLPKLSQKSVSFWRSSVTMTGWGKDSDKSTSVSPVLREVDSTVVSNFYCNFRYFFSVIRDTHICVSGWWWKTRGTCNGDSGGPLYIKEDDGRTLIGVTSFGIGFGCQWTWPPVFTRVTSYLDWIHQTAGIAPRS